MQHFDPNFIKAVTKLVVALDRHRFGACTLLALVVAVVFCVRQLGSRIRQAIHSPYKTHREADEAYLVHAH